MGGAMAYFDLNSFLFSPPKALPERIRLDFRPHAELATIDEPMRGDISGLASKGETLWAVSDETTSVERLSWSIEQGRYTKHLSFELGALFELPGDTEIDLEGLAVEDGWLWLCGSHALKRKRPKPHKHDAEKVLKRLSTVVREHNRCFLGRVPLESSDEGPVPVKEASDGRRAAALKFTKGGNKLLELLAEDEHLAASLEIPAKENGLDIEGIAARGGRVFLGLRGPVLRGIAVILELELKDDGAGRLSLEKAFGAKGKDRYRKHFLDLGGMGIRGMTMDGERLLLLIGPTMDLDGPSAIVALPDPFGALDEFTSAEGVRPVLRLPHGAGTDHAEGLTRMPDGRLLIVYDSPDPSRLHDDGYGMDADAFREPGT